MNSFEFHRTSHNCGTITCAHFMRQNESKKSRNGKWFKKFTFLMKFYIVDAFANKVFEGNPAAVVVRDHWLSDDLMLKLTIENNLSETAFAVKDDEKYKLRWFTPGGEIDLCGHATLATAFVLANFYEKECTEFHFMTKSGELIVSRKDDIYYLNFPSRPATKVDITQEMRDYLPGCHVEEAYLSRDLMLVLQNEQEVKDCTPNFTLISKIENAIGVLITAKGTATDFVSRAFFPKIKVNEDPVCGSAHCNLIPYWSKRLGKTDLVARQLSARGGTLFCKDAGERVVIGGKAALYAISETAFD